MLQAPPSRYKIIERDRRLITIDTLTGEEVGTTSSALPGARVDTATPRSTSSNMGGPAHSETKLGAGRSGSQSAPLIATGAAIGSPHGPLTILAGYFPRAQRQADGRVILTTAAYYDVDAPRQMRLTQGKTDALGVYLIVLGVLLMFAVLLVIMTDMIFGMIILVLITIKVGDPVNKTILRQLISDAEPVN